MGRPAGRRSGEVAQMETSKAEMTERKCQRTPRRGCRAAEMDQSLAGAGQSSGLS